MTANQVSDERDRCQCFFVDLHTHRDKKRWGRVWRSASSKLKKHDNLLQHKRSVMDLTNFIHTRENPSKSIDVTINKIEADLIRRNRTQISPVIACVEFLGKNNIALRGHRDDSGYYLDEDSGKNDFSNFVSKLKHKWVFTLEKCV